MCGISAIASVQPGKVPTMEMLQRMNDSQIHRGPDGEGAKIFLGKESAAGLGHRRLSIVDLAGGGQPMANENESIWITYNGEIYNHVDLRQELVHRGHIFRSRCDTEVIIHAYEEWGTASVDRLRGMFAFVIWDCQKQQLFAARDRLGVKPFYYVNVGNEIVCASEVKALFASTRYSPELNRRAIPEYFTFGYLVGEETLFLGVKKLLPGYWLLWKNGNLQLSQYWDIPESDQKAGFATEAELVDEFSAMFRESVRLRLMSDVPLGVFLSGGLDSSAIAAIMAEEMAEPVKTFSVGFESDYYSEFDYARIVAESIGADHHEVVLKPADAFELLPRLIWHEDEPIRNISSVALYAVSNLARQHVNVVLTGEGSDELFAGYERYWATLFNMRWGTAYHHLMPQWLHHNGIARTLWKWPIPLGFKKKLSHTFLNHDFSPQQIIFDNFYAIFPPRIHAQLFSSDVLCDLQELDPYRETMRYFKGRNKDGLLNQLLYTDQKTYLVELLMKQDNMSMAASIESRVPFLDHHLVEFATRVPDKLKIRGYGGKYLVKQALGQLLPPEILSRKKMGFPVPLCSWLRRGYDRVFRHILLSERTRDRNLFNETFICRLLAEHCRGTRDHTEALWTLLNFELWARIFLDGEGWEQGTAEMADVVSEKCARDAVLAV
jgi:asparagine synthase (glutamine-hydrolysing)